MYELLKIWTFFKLSTLHLRVGHEVEEASEQGVGRGVGARKVKIQDKHDESVLAERGAVVASLRGGEKKGS